MHVQLYVHRSGRTARASNSGLSILLISPQDRTAYTNIVKSLHQGKDIPTFPIDNAFLHPVRTRVNLARRVDQALHQIQKVHFSLTHLHIHSFAFHTHNHSHSHVPHLQSFTLSFIHTLTDFTLCRKSHTTTG
jgi:superfamily II DNA/RNA helicase